MKKITDSYIKEHMQQGISRITPNDAEKIWEQPVEKASGDEWYLDGTKKCQRSYGKLIGLVSSAAACLAVGILSWHMISFQTDATVYLDVNPSIELQINRKEKILSAEPYNEDGEMILEDMDLKNTDLDVGVNAILGSMVKHGYLSEAKNMVLLSVESKDQEKAAELEQELSAQISDCLESLVGSGMIFSQEIEVDEELENLSFEYDMSPGKAALIKKIVEKHPDLSCSELSGYSISRLNEYLEDAEIELKEYTKDQNSPEPKEEPEEDPEDDPEDEPESVEKPKEDREEIREPEEDPEEVSEPVSEPEDDLPDAPESAEEPKEDPTDREESEPEEEADESTEEENEEEEEE